MKYRSLENILKAFFPIVNSPSFFDLWEMAKELCGNILLQFVEYCFI